MSDAAPTPDKAIYMNVMIQHVASAYDAVKAGMAIKPEAPRRDVRDFFSRPLPNAIWQKLKSFQNDDFVVFVESCLATPESTQGSKGRV